MSFYASNVVASVVKAVNPDNSLAASQRVAGAAQDQLAAQGVSEADRRKVETSDKLEKLRLKRNEEQGERKRQHPRHAPQLPPDDQEHLIDTVA